MASREPDDGNDEVGESSPDAAAGGDLYLLARARSGDMEAYGELVGRHERRAYSIAWGFVRHREDAEDVVQEAFARTLERLDRIEPGRPFHPWFYRVVVNAAITVCRARSRRRSAELPDDLPSLELPPDERVARSRLREQLLRGLDALPERERTVVLLADVEELNSTEIAGIMEMPAGTVRYLLHRARRSLRQLLPAPGEEAR
jgi:RNA polymerase sigma-70 factor, ECF subfamily